jgi:hypothetical protein
MRSPILLVHDGLASTAILQLRSLDLVINLVLGFSRACVILLTRNIFFLELVGECAVAKVMA